MTEELVKIDNESWLNDKKLDESINVIPREIPDEKFDIIDLRFPSEKDKADYVSNVGNKLFQLSNMIYAQESEKNILSFLGLSRKKFYLFKRWFPEFRNAVAQGKLSMVERVESSQERRAIGMNTTDVEITNIYEPDRDGVMKLVQKKEKILKKEIPPDARAAEMILINRSPNRWQKAKSDSFVQNNTQNVINVSEDAVKNMLNRMNGLSIDTKEMKEEIKDAEVLDNGS